MKFQLDMTEINKIKWNGLNAISLFSGCGGSSLGYKLAGFRVLLANEFDKEAQEVYEQNHPKTFLLKDDVRNITGKQILKQIGLKKGELDVFDGSPPCSAFSTMGKREKGWGEEKKYSGQIQVVDDLFFEYARLIKETMPKMFVAENVKGMTIGQAKHLLGSNQNTFFPEKNIIHILRACGYHVEFRVLNAAHYEVPQTRERLIILGVRKDLGFKPTFPKKHKNIISTKDAIGDLINNGTDLKNSPKKTMFIKKYFRPGCTLAEAARIAKVNKLTGVMMYYTRRDRWKKPFQTILQAGDRAFHPRKDRALSIHECKRLCSFPDDFILPHSPKENWERLGRAVPPNLMKNVALHIAKLLKENTDATKRTSTDNRKRKTRSGSKRS